MKTTLWIAGWAMTIAAPAMAQTQMQMNADAAQKYKAADATMTAQWKRTYAYMKGRDAQERSHGGGFGYAAALLESQRAWIAFRDRECTIEGGEFAGGTLQPMARLQCLTAVTGSRTQQLRTLVWQH